MEHFNFNQSLRNLVNNLKGLFILSLALTTFGVGNAWGISKSKLTVNIVGGGQVAITRNNTAPSSYSSSSVSDNQSHGTFDIKVKDTYYVWLKPNTGFSGTCSINSTSDASITENGTNSYKVIITGSTGTTERTVTATFKATFYGKALAYADPVAGGGTWISLNGNWPTSDANYIAEDNSTKNENTTAAPTFNAQYDAKAKDGYEFVGWYTANNGGGTKKSSTVRYTEAFTASSVDQNVPTTIIRYAYFKALQYYYFKAQAGKVGAGNVYASFSDGSYSATSDIKTERATTLAQSQSTGNYAAYFKAEETDAAYHFAGWYTDAACTEANRVSTNLTYSEQISGSTATTEASAKTITRYAKFVQELTPEVTANYSGSPKAMFVDDEIASAFSFLNTSEIGSGLSFVSSNNNIITYDATNNKVIAKNEGTATLTFTQTKQDIIKAGEFSFTFNVSKIDNTLSVADVSPKMYVGDNVVDEISTNSDATINASSTDETIAYYDVANNKIVAQNTNNQSFNSKEVTITISQEATYKYTAVSKTIKVTVSKHVPTFTWSNTALYHNQTYNDFFTTNCSNALTVKSSSDDNVAYLENGSNAQKLNLKTLTKAASTTLTVTQAENYYWAEHTETKTVTPIVAPNHVPFTYNEAMFNDGSITITKAGTSNIFMVDNGRYVQLGEDATTVSGGDAWKDKYIVIKFNGIPDKVSFQYATSSGSATSSSLGAPPFRVEQSSDNKNYTEVYSDNRKSSSWSETITRQLNKETRYLKFFYGGNFGGQYQYITVTELKTFSTSTNKLDFGNDHQKGSPNPTLPLSLNYANVGHHITLTVDNDNFTVKPKEITNIGGENYGEFKDIIVEYSTAVVDTINATLVIEDELKNKAYVTLSGGTHKKAQTLTWASAYQAEHPTIPVGKPIENAASVYTGAPVTYTSSNPEIIEIINNGTAFKAVDAGSAVITAYQAGDAEWLPIESSKEFITTYKQIQNIHWDQSFRKIIYNESAPSQTMGLTASVYVVNPATGNEQYSDDRTAKIQYTSGNPDVVSVYGTVLTINGVGETTITASIEGDEDYESSSTTLPVRVRVPSIGCDDPLLVNYTNQIEFFAMNTGELTGDEIAIDRENGNPDKLSFWHEGKAWKLAIEYYKGSIKAQQKINGQWQDVQGSSVTPTKNQYNQLSNLQLDRNATHIRFVRPKGGEGYHHIKDIEVTLLKYIETKNTTIDFGSINVGSKESKSITIDYSNIQGDIEMTFSNPAITIEGAIETECGGRGQQVISIQYAPTVVETLNDQLYFRDKVTNVNLTVNLIGASVRNNQTITWNPSKTNILTTETIDLNATTSSGLPVSYKVTKGTDIVTINNGQATILGEGEVTIEASQQGNPLFSPALSVSKDFKITKDNPIITWPTATDIIYGQLLNESILNGGVAVDHNSTVVKGSFSWKIGSAQLNSGNQNQIVVFTPDNQNWYTKQETTVSVTVQKAQPDALAHAGNILYGAAVQTSTLTNEGTTEGTWSWTDEKKGQVLNVGTYEGLQVHFTPIDKTNYNEIDGTVSLTVTAATPTLEWTAKPETAQVHEVKTFTSSSTNTDNTAAITYSITDGTDCASINASTGEVTMLKAGTITIQASQAATTNFNAATSITTTCTINITPTEISTNPEIDGEIVYGVQLTDLKLKANTGAARNTINQQAVEGTFAITSGDISTAGEKTITVTFTPANTDMYASCTKDITVTVQKAQPDALAHAGDIIYGATVQTSALTNSGTTEGTWSWTDEKKDQVLNVGTYEGLQVHFTPTDQTNYNEIDGTVSLTVTKAQPTITWTGATTFEWGEINNYFVASNGGEVVMSSLDESIATIQNNKIIPVKAGTVTIQGDMAESANYQSATLTQTITINVPSENKFTNAAGDNDWNNPTNWSAGLVPEKMDEANIVVSGELNIEEKIVVGSLTIEDGGSVNVLQGGDLTIQSASGEADAFGDLYVKNGGDVTLNGTLDVHDFVIESSIGTADGSSKSGQITNADKLNFNEGDAYIDIHLDPSGSADDAQWYAFTVPFEVDIATGVYRQENDGSFKQMKDKTNFDIMQYNPAKRLTTGKGWEYYHGILHPGEFYYLAIDGTNNVYRFRKKAGVGFTTEAQVELHTNGDISNPNANWNPVGNPCLRYTTTDYDGFVQVYKNGQSAYLTVDASDVTYVVGCPFFVQAQEEGSLVLETSNATEGQFYAPRRMAVDKTKNQIQLLNQGKVEDQIFIMASEDATSDYKAGSDLLKAGVSKLCGQMWINAYGQQLSVQDASLQDETALYNLSLYAPKAGEYMLHVGSQTNYSEIYLTLNGIIIWNLSQSDYPISLFKGTTDEYGLVFKCTQQTMPTTIDASTKMKGVDKFIHHEQMYILHNGQLYNAMGATVK